MILPKITIITPSYNQGQFIRHTIDSVLSQNYPDLEYIVVDGGSIDDTVSVLKSYGDKIIWSSKKDKGQTDAINQGLKLSTGEILAYLNSDDILMPGALKRVGEYYARTGADWITGDYIVIDQDGRPTRSGWLIRIYKRLLMAIYSPIILKIADNMIPQPSAFWSRKAYEQIGKFDEKLQYVMDYDYWLRLSKHYRPHNLHVTLSGFRTHDTSKSETSRREMILEGNQILIKHGATRLQLFLHHTHSKLVRFTYNLLKK